jgi:Zn-dependent protease with chaperone function
MHFTPLVIPPVLAVGYVIILILAAAGMAVWTITSRPVRNPGRHRSAAAIARRDALDAALADQDIDPAPELVPTPVAPLDALDPAMPLSDVEALLALYPHELAKV